MADDIGAKDASIKVESNIPVIPERAMYRNNRREGHDSIGTTAPATDYYLAEGTTGWGSPPTCSSRTRNDAATDVTRHLHDRHRGRSRRTPFTMPANSRKTIRVNDVAAMATTDFSTQVHGYASPSSPSAPCTGITGTGEACHDSIGMTAPHTTFYLPDGETSRRTGDLDARAEPERRRRSTWRSPT